MLNKIFGSLIPLLFYWTFTLGDYYEECEGKNNGTFIAMQEDCSLFTYCDREDSYRDSCHEDTPYFSTEGLTCDINPKVCGNRPILSTDFDKTTAAVTQLPITSNSTSLEQVTSSTTNDITLIVNGSDISGLFSTISSASTLIFISTTPPSAPIDCPEVDNPNKPVFLPHPKSCSEYFLCYHGGRLPMRCSQMLHYDSRQQKCDYPENVKCHIKNVVSPRDQCLPSTFDVYPHPNNCNYYYKCSSGYLQVMQCPLNMGWHYEKRACMLRLQVKCYNSQRI